MRTAEIQGMRCSQPNNQARKREALLRSLREGTEPANDRRRTILASTPLRVYYRVPLSLPATTMGVSWFLVAWKWLDLRNGDERYGHAARLWARIFGINFGWGRDGHSDGVTVRHQLVRLIAICGQRNWSDACHGRKFAFFLERAFVVALVWGRRHRWSKGSLHCRAFPSHSAAGSQATLFW